MTKSSAYKKMQNSTIIDRNSPQLVYNIHYRIHSTTARQ